MKKKLIFITFALIVTFLSVSTILTIGYDFQPIQQMNATDIMPVIAFIVLLLFILFYLVL